MNEGIRIGGFKEGINGRKLNMEEEICYSWSYTFSETAISLPEGELRRKYARVLEKSME